MGELAEVSEEQGKREQLLSHFKDDSIMAKAAAMIPPEMLLLTEAELGKMFRVTPMDYALKRQIWLKFYDAEKTGAMIKMVDIYGGICSNPYFYNELTKNPARVAWLLSPPVDTAALIEEAFRFSFNRVRDDILTMPVTEKTAPILLKAFQLFADRHLGPVVQRIESKNLNVEVDGGSTQNISELDPHEIEAKMREIKQKLIPMKNVTPTDE